MTKKQIRKMIAYEGLNYAMLSTVLVIVFGSAITYGLFTLLQQAADYAVFAYPLVPLLVAVGTILFV